jgi:hypothetical protein
MAKKSDLKFLPTEDSTNHPLWKEFESWYETRPLRAKRKVGEDSDWVPLWEAFMAGGVAGAGMLKVALARFKVLGE